LAVSTTTSPGSTRPPHDAGSSSGGRDGDTPPSQPGSYGAPTGQPTYAYGQGGYQQPGYGHPGYGQGYPQGAHPAGGYGHPQPGQGYAQAPQGYGQQPFGYQQYGQPGHQQGGQPSPYVTGGYNPYAAAPAWPQAAERAARSGRLARLLLVLGILASLGYAIWALTARRGIFQDFVDQRSVSVSDARTSDHVDTTFLVIAGLLAVLALALWLVRLMMGRSRGGGVTVAGFVVSGIGMVTVVVGLVLSGTVGSDGDRVSEGRRAVAATIVTGSGFLILAVGLVIGLAVANARRESATDQAGASQPGAW
jgi:hypothetical protein